jgi:soluble lytic murein transglycosylase
LARGSHGEIGLMQLKPDTAKWIAHSSGIKWRGPATLENPVENVRLGVAYVSQLREKTSGFAGKYVSAYNLGFAKMSRMYKTANKPHEYSLRVMKNYKEFYTQMVASRLTIVADN